MESLVELLLNNRTLSGKGMKLVRSRQEERFVSYEELYDRALKVLYRLQFSGLAQGDELILQIDDEEHFLYIFWACIAGGIIPVPVSTGGNDEHRLKLYKIHENLANPYLAIEQRWMTKLEENETPGYSLSVLETRSLYVEDLVEGLDYHLPYGKLASPNRADMAFIQFSSGSTGTPKGVMLTHDNLLCNTEAIANRLAVTQQDIFYSWMPLTHDMGMIAFHLTPFLSQINHSIMSTNALIKSPALWMIKAQEHGATVLGSPNFGYKLLLTAYKPKVAEGWDLSKIRVILNGAEPISIELCHRFVQEMGAYGLPNTAILNAYGLAEGSVGVSIKNPDEPLHGICIDRRIVGIGEQIQEITDESQHAVVFAEVGYPIDYVSIRISNEKSEKLPERVIGQIQIKGRSVTSGYYRNEAATKKAVLQDGWLDTGDLGFMSEGRLYVTGRMKDIIFVNGKNYYPHDIERISEGVEGVELGKVAVVGLHNREEQREDIVVFVQYKRKVEQFAEIVVQLKKVINLKIGIEPALVLPIRSIPKTTSGKVQRYQLAEMLVNGEFDTLIAEVNSHVAKQTSSIQIAGPRNEIEQALLKLWCELLNTERIGIHDNFFEIGGSSSLLIQMVDEVEQLFPGMIEITDPFAMPTIAQIASYIASTRQETRLQPITLPKAYVLHQSSLQAKSSNVRLEYIFKAEELSRLHALARQLDVNLMSVGATAFAYMLFLIGAPSNLPLCLHLQNDGVHEYTFKFEKVSDFAEYIGQVNQSIKTDSVFHTLDQLRQQPVTLQEQERLPLFCDASLLLVRKDWLQLFDLVVLAEEKEQYFKIMLEFNHHRLQRTAMEEWWSNLIRFMQFLLQQANGEEKHLNEQVTSSGGTGGSQ